MLDRVWRRPRVGSDSVNLSKGVTTDGAANPMGGLWTSVWIRELRTEHSARASWFVRLPALAPMHLRTLNVQVTVGRQSAHRKCHGLWPMEAVPTVEKLCSGSGSGADPLEDFPHLFLQIGLIALVHYCKVRSCFFSLQRPLAGLSTR